MRHAPLLLALLATPGLLVCAPPEQARYEEQVREAPPGSLHAVHSERLRELIALEERVAGLDATCADCHARLGVPR